MAQTTIKCPYYHSHYKNNVCCEATDDEAAVSVHYQERITEYVRKFCGSLKRWEQCEYAKELNKKYGI